MKIKTAELTGAALDWAVAKCAGVKVEKIRELSLWSSASWHKYSTNWSQGGPIIERERICIHQRMGETAWWADYANPQVKPDGTGHRFLFKQAPTPLIAAMRCYVASKLGDEIDLPKELT
jgi:hypothetical protein